MRLRLETSGPPPVVYLPTGLSEDKHRIMQLEAEVGLERVQRVSAQRGLVPYVRSLEAFNQWLAERPKLSAQLEAILRELGLWKIELGYDPDKDLALSVVSPHRR